MPEMPEVQAHAERLTEDFGGDELRGFRPLTFTASWKTYAPAATPTGTRWWRSAGGQVPAHAVRAGDLRRSPDARRAAQGRREAGGQAPGGAVARWIFADGRAPAADRGRDRAQGRRVGPATPPVRTRSTTWGPRPPTSTGRPWAACWPSTACACTGGCATSGSWPDSAAGSPTRSPPGEAVAVRLDRQARRRGGRPAARTWASASPGRWRTSAPGRTCRRPRSALGAVHHRDGEPRPVRRHRPGRRVLPVHGELPPHVPDGRQGPGRQHDEQVPEVRSLHCRLGVGPLKRGCGNRSVGQSWRTGVPTAVSVLGRAGSAGARSTP